MPLVLRPEEEAPLRYEDPELTVRYTIAAKSLGKVLNHHIPQTTLDSGHAHCVSILDPQTNVAATGFLLNTLGFVITCLHVAGHFIRNAQALRDYRIRESNGTLARIDPTFFAYDQDNDLAILRAMRGTEVRAPPVRFFHGDPAPEEDIFYFSFKEGEIPLSHRGRVIGITPEGLIEFEGYGEPGYSGAPLFNTEGYFIGTLSRKGSQDGRACARRVTHARTLLEEVIANLQRNEKITPSRSPILP